MMKRGILICMLTAAVFLGSGCGGKEVEHTSSGPSPLVVSESGVWYEVEVYTDESLPGGSSAHIVSSTPLPWPEELKDIGTRRDKILFVNGVGAVLYPSFADLDAAIRDIAKACPRILGELQKAYSLEPLADKNWAVYQSAQKLYLEEPDRPEWYQESMEEFVKLECFFDIYENAYQNDRLVQMAEKAASVEKLLEEKEFLQLLPEKVRGPFCEKLRETEAG